MRKSKGYKNIAGLENLSAAEIKQRNLETYGESIKKYRKKAGLTVEQLASILQITSSSVKNWESGYSRPDPEYLYRMFTILDVEPNEFFGLSGIGTLLTNNERNLVDYYRMLDDAGKEDLETIAQSMSARAYHRKLKYSYDRMNDRTTMNRVVAAGDGADWEDHPEKEKVILYNSPEVSRADEIFIVNGDSMEPQFHSGDHVLVEYCDADELRNGDIGIFYVSGYGGVIKQKAYDRLHSLNPDFDDIFPYEEGAQVVGRVLGRITKDMIPSLEEQALYEEACEIFDEA